MQNTVYVADMSGLKQKMCEDQIIKKIRVFLQKDTSVSKGKKCVSCIIWKYAVNYLERKMRIKKCPPTELTLKLPVSVKLLVLS